MRLPTAVARRTSVENEEAQYAPADFNRPFLFLFHWFAIDALPFFFMCFLIHVDSKRATARRWYRSAVQRAATRGQVCRTICGIQTVR